MLATGTSAGRASGIGLRRAAPGPARGGAASCGGRDTLAVMSTGSGKSAIYQLAGLLLDGPTSSSRRSSRCRRTRWTPSRSARTAARRTLNSTLTRRASASEVLEDARGRRASSSCCSRPSSSPTTRSLARLRDGDAVAVRRRRGALRVAVGPRLPPRLPAPRPRRSRGARRPAAPGAHRDRRAARARRDRRACSGCATPRSSCAGFDRPNIRLGCAPPRAPSARRARCSTRSSRHAEGPGIVYARRSAAPRSSRRALRERGVRAAAYHGGLTPAAARASARRRSWTTTARST